MAGTASSTMTSAKRSRRIMDGVLPFVWLTFGNARLSSQTGGRERGGLRDDDHRTGGAGAVTVAGAGAGSASRAARR